MHATIEQLLSLRNGEPVSAVVKQHVGVCMLCHKQLEELTLVQDELNRLPVHTSPQNSWPGILARVDLIRQQSNHRNRTLRYGGFGLAASALLATLLFLNQTVLVTDVPQDDTGLFAGNDTVTGDIEGNNVLNDEPEDNIAGLPEPDIEQLIAQSAYLESILDALPRRPRVMRASTTELISDLQDTVALIDYRMNTETNLSDSQARDLWRHRIDLMNSLVYVRAAEVQQVAYTPN